MKLYSEVLRNIVENIDSQLAEGKEVPAIVCRDWDGGYFLLHVSPAPEGLGWVIDLPDAIGVQVPKGAKVPGRDAAIILAASKLVESWGDERPDLYGPSLAWAHSLVQAYRIDAGDGI